MRRSEAPVDPKELLDPIIENLLILGDPTVVTLTTAVVDRIKKEEVALSIDDKLNSASSFDLELVELGNILAYRPTLSFNWPLYRANIRRGESAMEAALVCSMALLDQFPENGYQSHIKQVYQKAVQAEADFLSRCGFPGNFFDREPLILKPARAFMDTSYADYQKAIEDAVFEETDSWKSSIIKQLGTINPATFVITRQYFWDNVESEHSAKAIIESAQLRSLSEEERSYFFASALIGLGMADNYN